MTAACHLLNLLLLPMAKVSIYPISHHHSMLMPVLPAGRGYPLGRWERCFLAAWGIFLCCGFTLSFALQPAAKGFGTHQQLGLPPCTVQFLLEIPCPSCGMTTSFAHFARGQFGPALRANPAGLFLALACAVMLPWSAVSVWRGRMWLVDQPIEAALWLLGSFVVLSLVNWGFVLAAA